MFQVRYTVHFGDEGGPFGAGFQEQASSNRKLLSPNGGGGERYGKGVAKHAMCGPERRRQVNHWLRPRNNTIDGTKTGALRQSREKHRGNLTTGDAVSGVEVA